MRSKAREVVAVGKDPLGRTVVLEQERWGHVCEHEQLEGHELAVMTAVERAEVKKPGNFPGAEVVYARGLVARWLAVVVEYHGMNGRVITAYPCSKDPKKSA